MDKKRIFIAIPVSSELASKIGEFQDEHSGLPVRWLADKNLHITLVPPQELTDEQLTSIIERLGSVSASPFELKFTDLGVGPSPSSPRMFWITGQSTPEIENLKSGIEQAVGYRPDRPFRMHITLARFKPEQAEAVRHIKADVHWNLLVKSFVVMQSKLTQTQADYTILQEYQLTN